MYEDPNLDMDALEAELDNMDAVPEPSELLLVLTGLAIVGALSRRRRAA